MSRIDRIIYLNYNEEARDLKIISNIEVAYVRIRVGLYSVDVTVLGLFWGKKFSSRPHSTID